MQFKNIVNYMLPWLVSKGAFINTLVGVGLKIWRNVNKVLKLQEWGSETVSNHKRGGAKSFKPLKRGSKV